MSRQSDNKSNSRPLALLAVGIFIGALTVGTIFLVWDRDSHSGSRSSIPTYSVSSSVAPGAGTSLSTAPGAVDPRLSRIASRFVCSCGTCGEKRLDICTCETAQQERAFILDQLRQGRSEAEAADAVNRKYGGLKS